MRAAEAEIGSRHWGSRCAEMCCAVPPKLNEAEQMSWVEGMILQSIHPRICNTFDEAHFPEYGGSIAGHARALRMKRLLQIPLQHCCGQDSHVVVSLGRKP